MPILGETIQGIDNEEQPGGKGANTAAACGNLGADICFLGQLGYEQFTDIIIQELKSKNVDVSYIPKLPDVKTGNITLYIYIYILINIARAFVIIFPNGENSIIIIGGANVAYSKEALREEFVQAIQKSDILLLQREIPEYVNIQGAKIANAAGKLVVLDVGGRDEPLTDELLNCVDILSPNSVFNIYIYLDRISTNIRFRGGKNRGSGNKNGKDIYEQISEDKYASETRRRW